MKKHPDWGQFRIRGVFNGTKVRARDETSMIDLLTSHAVCYLQDGTPRRIELQDPSGSDLHYTIVSRDGALHPNPNICTVFTMS